jgi:hypothetical protein
MQGSGKMISSPSEIGADVRNAVLWLKLAVEAIGALVIGVGMSLAAWRFVAGPEVAAPRDIRYEIRKQASHSSIFSRPTSSAVGLSRQNP